MICQIFKKMKKFITIISVIALIAVIVIVLAINKKSTEKKTELAATVSAAVPVRIDVVKEEPVNLGFTSNGALEPVRELSFVSDVAGRVVNIYADEGTVVSAGQALIQVDDEMLKADFAASEAAYKSLKDDLERFTNANKEGGVTDQQLETIRTQYIAAESRYLTSQRRLSDARVKSPIPGSVTKRYIEVGSYLNPGARLFDIIDDSQLKVWCNVTERQVLLLEKGQKVTVTCNTFPGEEYAGTITYVGTRADRSLSYPVEISIAKQDKKLLKAGMYVTVSFDVAGERKGIIIPRSAITGSVLNAKVFTVRNGVASERNVVVGAMMDKNVEVTSGLEQGDSIVVAGIINVSDGVKVRNVK